MSVAVKPLKVRSWSTLDDNARRTVSVTITLPDSVDFEKLIDEAHSEYVEATCDENEITYSRGGILPGGLYLSYESLWRVIERITNGFDLGEMPELTNEG